MGGLRGTEERLFKVSRGLVINFKITKGMREREGGEEAIWQPDEKPRHRRKRCETVEGQSGCILSG
jgi:hypothetical protein